MEAKRRVSLFYIGIYSQIRDRRKEVKNYSRIFSLMKVSAVPLRESKDTVERSGTVP